MYQAKFHEQFGMDSWMVDFKVERFYMCSIVGNTLRDFSAYVHSKQRWGECVLFSWGHELQKSYHLQTVGSNSMSVH